MLLDNIIFTLQSTLAQHQLEKNILTNLSHLTQLPYPTVSSLQYQPVHPRPASALDSRASVPPSAQNILEHHRSVELHRYKIFTSLSLSEKVNVRLSTSIYTTANRLARGDTSFFHVVVVVVPKTLERLSICLGGPLNWISSLFAATRRQSISMPRLCFCFLRCFRMMSKSALYVYQCRLFPYYTTRESSLIVGFNWVCRDVRKGVKDD